MGMSGKLCYDPDTGKLLYNPDTGKLIYGCTGTGVDCGSCDAGTVPVSLLVTLPNDMEDAETRYGASPISDGCSNCADINGGTFVCDQVAGPPPGFCLWQYGPVVLGGNCFQLFILCSLNTGTGVLRVSLNFAGGNHGGAGGCDATWSIGGIGGNCTTALTGLSLPLMTPLAACGAGFSAYNGCASAADQNCAVSV